jgi:hypothetical protein
MAMQTNGVARRVGRLFVIKTRWEAWAVTWAIAVGAAERGKYYLALYPGTLGWLFFVICCAVVFVAGAKLLDATGGEPARAQSRTAAVAVRATSSRRLRPLSRSRPRGFRPDDGSRSRFVRRKD